MGASVICLHQILSSVLSGFSEPFAANGTRDRPKYIEIFKTPTFGLVVQIIRTIKMISPNNIPIHNSKVIWSSLLLELNFYLLTSQQKPFAATYLAVYIEQAMVPSLPQKYLFPLLIHPLHSKILYIQNILFAFFTQTKNNFILLSEK